MEIGANDGITQSNTKYLEVFRKWKGILVEPYLENARKCRRWRARRTKIFHAACVSFEYNKKDVPLVWSDLMTTSLDLELQIQDSWKHAKDGESYLEDEDLPIHQFFAPARTLTSILEEARAPNIIDLFVLDVEGAEMEVLKGIDFHRYSFGLMVIETLNLSNVGCYLEKFGYRQIGRISAHDYLFSTGKVSLSQE